MLRCRVYARVRRKLFTARLCSLRNRPRKQGAGSLLVVRWRRGRWNTGGGSTTSRFVEAVDGTVGKEALPVVAWRGLTGVVER